MVWHERCVMELSKRKVIKLNEVNFDGKIEIKRNVEIL